MNYSAHIEALKSEILDRSLVSITTDIHGIIIDASKGFEVLSGYSRNELIGVNHQIVRHPDTPKEMFTNLWNTITKGKSWCGEIKNQSKCGKVYWSKICIEPLIGNDSILGYLGIYTNITEQKELIRQASTDPLTGIYNRSKFNLLLSHEVEEAYRSKNTFAVIFIDLDHFKFINDRYGHLEGDRVLIEFAALTRDSLRKNDLFCRWGGEEFIIVLSKTDMSVAYTIAEKLRNLVQHHDFALAEPVTLSIGISQYHPSKSIDETIKTADRAMYTAKNQGRNQTVLAHDHDSKED